MSRGSGWQRWRSALGWLMAATLVLPLLVALAWVLSNLQDVAAVPTPPELVVPAPKIDEGQNAFFALAGIKAPLGADPVLAPKAQWQEQRDFLSLPPTQRAAASAQRMALDPSNQPVWQGGPSGPPWVCSEGEVSCVGAWLAEPSKLAAQRAAALWGPRCDALDLQTLQFEEILPTPFHFGAFLGAHASGAVACDAWFRSAAVLAWAAGDRAAVLRAMEQADRLNRALLSGSRSLVAQAIALRVARRWLGTAAALAVRDPGLAADLLPLLEGWPMQRENIVRWMQVEAQSGRSALAEVARCAQPGDEVWPLGAEPGRLVKLADAFSAWMCRRQIGFHPERTQQSMDAQWSARIAALRDRPLGEAPPEAESRGWRWTNTLGAMLVDVAEGAYADYLLRHADLELQHRAVRLALQIQQQGVAAPDRKAWTARQALPAHESSRLSWSADGKTLFGLRFSRPQGTENGLRDAIRVVWP